MVAATPIRLAIDDLDLATLKSEINEGHSVDLVRGEAVIAEVRVPFENLTGLPAQISSRPDFAARLREMFPNGPVSLDSTAMIREDRDSRG